MIFGSAVSADCTCRRDLRAPVDDRDVEDRRLGVRAQLLELGLHRGHDAVAGRHLLGGDDQRAGDRVTAPVGDRVLDRQLAGLVERHRDVGRHEVGHRRRRRLAVLVEVVHHHRDARGLRAPELRDEQLRVVARVDDDQVGLLGDGLVDARRPLRGVALVGVLHPLGALGLGDLLHLLVDLRHVRDRARHRDVEDDLALDLRRVEGRGLQLEHRHLLALVDGRLGRGLGITTGAGGRAAARRGGARASTAGARLVAAAAGRGPQHQGAGRKQGPQGVSRPTKLRFSHFHPPPHGEGIRPRLSGIQSYTAQAKRRSIR